MKLYLKVVAALLLLLQAVPLASPQEQSDSPAPATESSWLAEAVHGSPVEPNPTDTEENAGGGDWNGWEPRNDQGGNGVEPRNDQGGNEEEPRNDQGGNEEEPENEQGGNVMYEMSDDEPSDGLPGVTNTETAAPIFPSTTTNQPNVGAPTHDSNVGQSNTTAKEEKVAFNTSATAPAQTFSNVSNPIGVNSTTGAPEETGRINATESTTKTEITTKTPEGNDTTTNNTSDGLPPEIILTPDTPKANLTDERSPSGSSSERGLETDSHDGTRQGVWAAVLGTMAAVACVGLVTYIILRKSQQKAFSHRKLVEDFPSEPVLRLDNSEPLDLNLGGSAFYNPGLQGDNIQMSNFPNQQRK